jgi:hypothetical protein
VVNGSNTTRNRHTACSVSYEVVVRRVAAPRRGREEACWPLSVRRNKSHGARPPHGERRRAARRARARADAPRPGAGRPAGAPRPDRRRGADTAVTRARRGSSISAARSVRTAGDRAACSGACVVCGAWGWRFGGSWLGRLAVRLACAMSAPPPSGDLTPHETTTTTPPAGAVRLPLSS